MAGVETGTITTDIPARMDRLPWARWHWLVVIGLGGTVEGGTPGGDEPLVSLVPGLA